MTKVLRDEADAFKLSEHAFGARKLGEHQVFFVVEAANEFVAAQRVSLIAVEFFSLDVGTLELVRLERTVNGVPNFLEGYFQSVDAGNEGNNPKQAASSILH